MCDICPKYDRIFSMKKEFEMNKAKFLSAILIAGLCVFTACNDDKDKGEILSKLKPEEHKEKLANEGEVIIDKMSAVADLETYAVVDVFFDLMDGSETKSSSAVKFGLNEINSVKTGTKVSVEVAEVYKISDEFKNEAGIYSWDVQDKKWDKIKESETELTYKFKVDKIDAEVSVTSFKTIAASINDDRIGNFESELPVEFKMHIKLGDKTLTSFELAAEWNDDNTPKKLVEEFVLEGFKFTCELKNTNETISLETSFKLEDYTIYANGIELNGDFDYKTVMDTGFSNTADEYSEALGQEVIEKGNVWLQLSDIKVQGIFDAKSFIEDLDPKKEPTDLELIDLLNEHSKLYIKYAGENEIIAEGEFFLEEFEDYNETYNVVSFKMIFSDGSSVADNFFKSGFSDMITKISHLIKDVNSSYDLDIDTVD